MKNMKNMKNIKKNDVYQNFIIIDKIRKNYIIAEYEGLDHWRNSLKFCSTINGNFDLVKYYYHYNIHKNYDVIELNLPFDVATCINKFL